MLISFCLGARDNMGKNVFLYRCRTSSKYNIDAFCRDCINGTVYSEFLQYGELNAWIPPEALKKYGATEDRERGITNTIIDNCAKNYYLACFSLTNPLTNKHLLAKYAGSDGFVLMYNFDALNNDKKMAILLDNVALELINVNYSDKKFNLLPVVSPLALMASEHEGTDEEFEIKITQYIETHSYSKEVGECTVGLFSHKARKYKMENEVRLILQKIKHKSKYVDLLKSKPVKVLISRKMNVFSRIRIEKHAQTAGILIDYYD